MPRVFSIRSWTKTQWGVVGGALAALVLFGAAVDALGKVEPFAFASHRWTRSLVATAQADDVDARNDLTAALQIGRIEILGLKVITLDGRLFDLDGRLDMVRLRLDEVPGDPFLRELKTELQRKIDNLDLQRERTVCQKLRLEVGNPTSVGCP